MVARARLLEPLEVRVEVGLGVEGGSVDPRELGVLLVAAPVRAREARELDRLDRRRVLEVRAAAEIGERTLRVQRDRALGAASELDLVGLRLRLEACDRVVAGELLARPLAPLGDLASDLLLDRLEVGLRDRLRELEVVVEAVGDRRADRDLHAGMEAHDRLGEQMGGRVPEDVERVRIGRVARREELDVLAVRQRQPKIPRRPVHPGEDGLLGELRSDRARGVEAAGAVGKLELGRVGEDDLHRALRIDAGSHRGCSVHSAVRRSRIRSRESRSARDPEAAASRPVAGRSVHSAG